MYKLKILLIVLVYVISIKCTTAQNTNVVKDKYTIKKIARSKSDSEILIIRAFVYGTNPLEELKGTGIVLDQIAKTPPHFIGPERVLRLAVIPGKHAIGAVMVGYKRVDINKLRVDKGDSIAIDFYLPADDRPLVN